MISRALVLIITAAAALTPVLAQFNCKHDGSEKGYLCSDFVQDFCKFAGEAPPAGGQRENRCYQTGDHRCEFTVFNAGSSESLNLSDCQSTLNNLIGACKTGGKAMSGSFELALDPDHGSCSHHF